MILNDGPLYELRVVAITDAAIPGMDDWLRDAIRRSLQEEGIVSARAVESDVSDAETLDRILLFQATDDATLDALRDGFFSALDATAAEQFGNQVSIESRVLRADVSREISPGESPVCLNCGTRLRGQYCGHCGQRSRSRLISIWQLLREAFGDLFELDSRLWKTLLPLFARPGRLTRDYLEGRRARYMPPFRTYLVLSIIFFVVAFFDPKDDFSLFFEPEPPPSAEEVAATEAKAAAAAALRERAREAARQELESLQESRPIIDSVVDEIVDDDDSFSLQIGDGNSDDATDIGDLFGDCAEASISDDDVPSWIKKRFTDERVQQMCERNKARGVENFGEALIDSVPIALIVLLPLLAFVLKLLYPLSRRYFVEHLLFFVHFHAFFFLILTLQVMFAGLMGLFGAKNTAINGVTSLLLVIASFYIPVYLYKAMRHVYNQGHLVTVFKYVLLLVAYFVGAILSMLWILLVTLMSA